MAFKKITKDDIEKTTDVREKLRKEGSNLDLSGKTIKSIDNTKSSAGDTTQKSSISSSVAASDASSSAEQAEASLSQTSEAPQSTTEVIDVSPNVAPSAETKSGENRLGYIAILIILAMIFIVCLQRFFSERKIEKECDGAVSPKKESA